MIDTLFIVLESLKLLINMMSRIFSVIFVNYFPDTKTEESDKGLLKNLSL